MKYTIVFIMVLALTSCDFYDDRLTINNKSSSRIFVTIVKDTILSLGENRTFIFTDWRVGSFTKRKLVVPGKDGWEWEAKSSINQELHVFILNEDTLRKYTPQEIVEGQLFEKRIDVGLPQLEKDNWEVIYQ